MATNFQAMFDLPEALGAYTPEFPYVLTDLSAYSDEELKRTAELGVSLLLLKHIFEPDLRACTCPTCSNCGTLCASRKMHCGIWKP